MTTYTAKMLVDALEDCIEDSKQVLSDMIQTYGENYKQERIAAQRETIAKAEAALSAAKGGGWISVKDALPEKNVEVLVAFEGITIPSTGQYTGNHRDVNGWCYPSENMGSTYQGSDPIVTAWQPLPKPPKD